MCISKVEYTSPASISQHEWVLANTLIKPYPYTWVPSPATSFRKADIHGSKVNTEAQ